MCGKLGGEKSRFLLQHPSKVKRSKSNADVLVTCNRVSLIELYELFFYSDRWCGQLENNGEGHNSQDVMERPCLHLY